MKRIETILKEELCQLRKITKEARKRLETAPSGRLRIKKKRGGVEYYFKNDNDINTTANSKNGRYMKKSEESLAKDIAQRCYDERVIKCAEKRIKAINTFLKDYNETSLGDIYQKTNPFRRDLIYAPILSDDEFIKQWQGVEYKGKFFDNDDNEIITERGERVRSKSEKIIADKLYALGIPYRYEYPLTLKGNVEIYPDFTILRMPSRKEVYLEHFGMMDDENYVNNTIYKLSTYERNGIYLGVNLFITYETSKKILNTKMLDEFFKELFCVE